MIYWSVRKPNTRLEGYGKMDRCEVSAVAALLTGYVGNVAGGRYLG